MSIKKRFIVTRFCFQLLCPQWLKYGAGKGSHTIPSALEPIAHNEVHLYIPSECQTEHAAARSAKQLPLFIALAKILESESCTNSKQKTEIYLYEAELPCKTTLLLVL